MGRMASLVKDMRERWLLLRELINVGYFDDNIKGGEGMLNTVGGQVDPEQARPVAHS